MYCGDETGSFVGEIGSHSSRFGYGGEDAPKFVVPSYCLSCPNNKNKLQQRQLQCAPSSCYHWRGGGLNDDSSSSSSNVVDPYRTPLRRVQAPPPLPHSSYHEPIVDPNAYLSQGECVEDWDAYETLWESALDTLNVRDPAKHTNSHRNVVRHWSGATSQSLPTQGSPKKPSLVHPLLVVRPGYTHLVGGPQETRGNEESSALPLTAEDGMIIDDGDEATTTRQTALRVGSEGDTSSRHEKLHRVEMARLAELMVESLGCPALFLAPSPMLTAFAHGRQTALVVDVGASGCRVTPVVDGLLLRQAQRRNGRGGDWLGNVGWKALAKAAEDQNTRRRGNPSSSPSPITVSVNPRYQISLGNTSTSNSLARRGIFHRWAMQDLMYEIRTSTYTYLQPWCYDPSIPFLSDPKSNNATAVGEASSLSVLIPPGSPNYDTVCTSSNAYELPDGTLIDLSTQVGKDLCRIPELLFTDSLPFQSSGDSSLLFSTLSSSLLPYSTVSSSSLPRMIHASLTAVGDVDARKELASNILVTGGSSLFPNFEQRLSYEVPRLVSSAFKTRVTASKYPVERLCATWIGGSILTSLGSFQQLWLSKAEYEEYGAALAVQRFPL